MLTKRLMLHLMIEEGYDPIEIMNVLGISRDTVFKHKMISESGDDKYKMVIDKIASRQKTKQFLKKIENLLRPIGTIMEARTNMRARAKLIYGEID